jgi:hypothetical protein
VDRVSIRSFRAADLVERGLKDLARSRLDTTREVVFQPLGAASSKRERTLRGSRPLFREDGFNAPEGHFTRMDLRLERQLVDRLAVLDPQALEARLGEAARNAVVREWPRAQGVYVVRFEPSARGGAEPVAHATCAAGVQMAARPRPSHATTCGASPPPGTATWHGPWALLAARKWIAHVPSSAQRRTVSARNGPGRRLVSSPSTPIASPGRPRRRS